MSDRQVRLKYKDELFAMDFVRTTPFGPEVKPYEQKPDVGQPGSVNGYDRVGLRSGPYELIGQVDRMKDELQQLEARFGTILGILIGLVTLIVAAGAAFLGVLVYNAGDFDLPNLSKGDVAIIVAAVALVASLGTFVGPWLGKPKTGSKGNDRSKGS